MTRKTKNTISNIAGLFFAIGTAMTGLGATVLPPDILKIGVITVAISGAVIGYLTGKKVE